MRIRHASSLLHRHVYDFKCGTPCYSGEHTFLPPLTNWESVDKVIRGGFISGENSGFSHGYCPTFVQGGDTPTNVTGRLRISNLVDQLFIICPTNCSPTAHQLSHQLFTNCLTNCLTNCSPTAHQLFTNCPTGRKRWVAFIFLRTGNSKIRREAFQTDM